MSKVYAGERVADGGGPLEVFVRTEIGGRESTGKLRHVELHSPDGFQWGYGGSGPADLALAILLDHLGEEPSPEELRSGDCLAVRLYQDFKWAFVARFGNRWSITSESIDLFLERAEIKAQIASWRQLQAELAEIRALEAADEELGEL